MMSIPEQLNHAYIITGGSRAGREEYARRLAAAYLCEGNRPPCGQCRPCRKVASGTHPDVTTVTLLPDKREIVVDQARALRADAYVRPNEGRRKVYVVHPADDLNEEAQSALLKVLEEGPEFAAFLLLAEQPGRLLSTVRSRCEQLTLPPEEEQADPRQLEKAQELVRRLLGSDELAAAEYLVGLENEKMKSNELTQLLALAEQCAGEALLHTPRRATQLLHLLKQHRQTSVYNPAPGHVLGWLATEMFR